MSDNIFGITWTPIQRDVLELENPFRVDDCKITLTFTFEYDLNDVYPRQTTQNNWVEIGIFSNPNRRFQTEEISMTFDSVDFNRFEPPTSDNNIRFADSLSSRVMNIYKRSWINQYYDFNVKEDENIVFFYDNFTKSSSSTYRFDIYLYIPDITKLYFKTPDEWEILGNETLYKSELFSNVLHGFNSNGVSVSKSLYYTSPYFIKLNQPTKTISNYLEFKGFFKLNVNKCILSMITYNEFEQTFTVNFLPKITLSFLQTLTLNKTLEFILVDSDDKQITLEDNNQLFISLTIQS